MSRFASSGPTDHDPLVTLQGVNMVEVAARATGEPDFARAPARAESLRQRNSSGSVTPSGLGSIGTRRSIELAGRRSVWLIPIASPAAIPFYPSNHGINQARMLHAVHLNNSSRYWAILLDLMPTTGYRLKGINTLAVHYNRRFCICLIILTMLVFIVATPEAPRGDIRAELIAQFPPPTGNRSPTPAPNSTEIKPARTKPREIKGFTLRDTPRHRFQDRP
jgi:hypothetical protein